MSDLKASNTSETLQPKLNVKLPPTAEAVLEAAIPESQGDIDRETSKIRLQTEKLKLKRELLELEKLTDDIEKIREEKSNLAYAHDTVEDSIKYQKESMRANQEACTHKKGGEATQLLGGAPSMGDNANNYALLTHTFTSGVIFRMCMRCGRTWFPKDPDYNWAMRLPSKIARQQDLRLQDLQNIRNEFEWFQKLNIDHLTIRVINSILTVPPVTKFRSRRIGERT